MGFLRKQLDVGTGGREIILTPLRAIREELISCHCVSGRMLLFFLMFGFHSALFRGSRLILYFCPSLCGLATLNLPVVIDSDHGTVALLNNYWFNSSLEI